MNAAAGNDCTLRHRLEILAIVERMKRERTRTTIEFGDHHAIVSSVLDVLRDRDALVFDVAHDAEQNRLLFASPALAFKTELDNIRISFETKVPLPVTLADGLAALVDLPLALLRLQRREWFRAALPVRPPIRCTLVDGAGGATAGQAIDLSPGGAAVIVEGRSDGLPLPGSDHEVILSLPGVGPMTLEATLRTVSTVAGMSGRRVRMGFRFESVSATTSGRIRRYVQQVEGRQLRTLGRRG